MIVKSVQELLDTTDIAKVSHTLAADAERTRAVLDVIVAPPDKNRREWVTGMMMPSGRRQVRAVCNAWNVSESQLIRLAIAELAATYGFKSEGILIEADRKAANRHHSARRPFITREEATQQRKKNCVKALDSDWDDPPQPPGVHEPRCLDAAEE